MQLILNSDRKKNLPATRRAGSHSWTTLRPASIAATCGVLEAGLGRIRRNIDDIAIPELVDSMKELPMTVLVRPFNLKTLATLVHQCASDELLEDSTLSALTIVAAGLPPVILLGRAKTGTARQKSNSCQWDRHGAHIIRMRPTRRLADQRTSC